MWVNEVSRFPEAPRQRLGVVGRRCCLSGPLLTDLLRTTLELHTIFLLCHSPSRRPRRCQESDIATMSTLKARVFSYNSDEDLHEIAKDDFLDCTLQTAITWTCNIASGHSIFATLTVHPFQVEGSLGNVSYRYELWCELCCFAIKADAERDTRAWAQRVVGKLRHAPCCKFESMQM